MDNGDLNAAGTFEYRSESFIQNEDKYSKFPTFGEMHNTQIDLQNHGFPVSFRNIKIRVL